MFILWEDASWGSSDASSDISLNIFEYFDIGSSYSLCDDEFSYVPFNVNLSHILLVEASSSILLDEAYSSFISDDDYLDDHSSIEIFYSKDSTSVDLSLSSLCIPLDEEYDDKEYEGLVCLVFLLIIWVARFFYCIKRTFVHFKTHKKFKLSLFSLTLTLYLETSYTLRVILVL